MESQLFLAYNATHGGNHIVTQWSGFPIYPSFPHAFKRGSTSLQLETGVFCLSLPHLSKMTF